MDSVQNRFVGSSFNESRNIKTECPWLILVSLSSIPAGLFGLQTARKNSSRSCFHRKASIIYHFLLLRLFPRLYSLGHVGVVLRRPPGRLGLRRGCSQSPHPLVPPSCSPPTPPWLHPSHLLHRCQGSRLAAVTMTTNSKFTGDAPFSRSQGRCVDFAVH